MKTWKKNALLIIFAIIFTIVPLLIHKNKDFSGTDDQAQAKILEIEPSYSPWASEFFDAPSDSLEVLIFALQGLVGFVLVVTIVVVIYVKYRNRKA